MIALLGKRDTPTDGVEDYCAHLREALALRGDDLQLVRAPWAEQGWGRALGWLWRESRGWPGQWTLVQYTALGWSRHGFSLPFLAVLALLRMRRARVAVVFHDAEPYHGTRLVDRLRRACQRRVMRASYRWVQKSIVTVPLPSATFLGPGPGKAAFVPIGANIPAAPANGRRSGAGAKTVAVFGVTGGGTVGSEIADIAYCMRQVSRCFDRPTLLLLGRDSDAAEARLRQALKGVPVQIEARGILPPADVSRALQAADALLFVRGPVSTRKGSAMAGIACGLPVVGYAEPHAGPPLTEAGVMLVPQGDQGALAEALIRVLRDGRLWQELHQRNQRAQAEHFSWNAIAGRLLNVLDEEFTVDSEQSRAGNPARFGSRISTSYHA
jgi:glycosyltransferase involved in cell wall biosynthesis